MILALNRHQQRLAALALLAVALLLPPAVQAKVYLYRQDAGNQRVYTDLKPERRPYTVIGTSARPVASASCVGMTPARLRARAALYDAIVQRQARAQGVPASLIHAVMRVESCADRYAISPVGARGLMQLMPGTASELGVRDSFNPEQNIAGGVRYLRKMLDRFDRNPQLALAAYNAGPQAVLRHGGIPPYKETRHYVRRVMANYQAAAEPRGAKPVRTRRG